MNHSVDELGSSLFDFEAIAPYSDPSIYQEYLKACAQLEELDARGKVVYAWGPDLHKIATDENEAARNAIYPNIISKLRKGELVLAGYVAGPAGRDPDAPRTRVPPDVLSLRNMGAKRRDQSIEGNALTFYDVRIYTPEEFIEYTTEKSPVSPTTLQNAATALNETDHPLSKALAPNGAQHPTLNGVDNAVGHNGTPGKASSIRPTNTSAAYTFTVFVDSQDTNVTFLPVSSFNFLDAASYLSIANSVKALSDSSEIRRIEKNLEELHFRGVAGSSTYDSFGFQEITLNHRNNETGHYRIVVPKLGKFEAMWRITQFEVLSRKDDLNRFNLSLAPDGPIEFIPIHDENTAVDQEKIRAATIPVSRVSTGEFEELPIAEAIDLIADDVVRPVAPDDSFLASIPEIIGISLAEAYERFVCEYPHVPGCASLQEFANTCGSPMPSTERIRSHSTRVRADIFGPVDAQGGYLTLPAWHGIADETHDQFPPQVSIPGVDPELTRRFFDAYVPFLTRAARYHFFQLLIKGELLASGDEPDNRSANDRIQVGRRLWQLQNVIVDAPNGWIIEVNQTDGQQKVVFSNVIVREDTGFKLRGEDRARDFLRKKEKEDPGYSSKYTNARIARDMLDSGEFQGYQQTSLQTILSTVNPKSKS